MRSSTGLLLLAALATVSPVYATESVLLPAVVVGPQAPELERYAAEQLCHYLAQLFSMQVQPSATKPANASALFLIGSPATNPLIRQVTRRRPFPKLSEQGMVMRRLQVRGTPALIVGGGSPRATLWAVYELVERWGVRYLLHGDVIPQKKPAFHLPELDRVMEPKLPVRQWRVVNVLACGPESWGMQDYRPMLDKLAKLKFNRLLIATWAHHPFLDYEAGGIQRRFATLFFGFRYPITDDMIGRSLFGNETEFWNRDLPVGSSYRQMTESGIELIRELMAYGRKRGLQSVLTPSLTDFPPEFGPLLKGVQPVHQLGELTVIPGPQTALDDPGLNELTTAILRATVNTYPEADYLLLHASEHRQWLESYEQAWKALDAKYGLEKHRPLAGMLAAAANRKGSAVAPERAVREVKGDIVHLYFLDRLLREEQVLKGTRRPDMKFIYDSYAEEVMTVVPRMLPPGWEAQNFVDYTPSRIAGREQVLASIPVKEIPTSLIFTLHDDNVGIVPQTEMEPLAKLTGKLIQYGWAGFSTRYWLLSDHDPVISFLSKASWDATATAEAVARDQFRAACGNGCVDDMAALFRGLGAATHLLEWEGMSFSFPTPTMLMRNWRPGPLPEYLAQVRKHYQQVLDAAHRAWSGSPPERRDYPAYWLGRLQFGIGYLDTVARVKQAATAEATQNRPEAAGQALKALETLRGAIEAFARVARNRSDVGTIAVLNEHAYRPLKVKLQELQGK